jgi:hypothetical protein
VIVRIWWTHWPNGTPAPRWNDGTWNAITPSAPQTVLAWPNPRVEFPPFTLPLQPPGVRRLIVAQATCAADPANTDTSTAFPCSTLPTPLIDLIAGDNNLGLRLHVVP